MMNNSANPTRSPVSRLHAVNVVIAMLAGIVSITGGIYSLKNNLFSANSYGNLHGIVRDERIAKPLKLAAVEVSDADGAVLNTATTDSEGRYRIEPLKTGNYVVKFIAPLHKVETKTVRIEKDFTSSIDVDLVPDEAVAQNYRAEAEVNAVPTAPVYYSPPPRIPAAYPPSQTVQKSAPADPAPQQPEAVPLPQNTTQQYPAARRRPHRHPEYGASGQETPASGQGTTLAEVTTQLLDDWLSKKKE